MDMMSRLFFRLLPMLPLMAVVLLPACESSEPKRRKAVPPPMDVSGQPWNRPTKAEAAGRFGSMMPQSR